jgi:DNA replication protein DnaC
MRALFEREATCKVTCQWAWGTYLGDMTLASTILDRLMRWSRMLEFEGKSYRLKEAAQRLVVKAQDD